jgi:hypothetical protein
MHIAHSRKWFFFLTVLIITVNSTAQTPVFEVTANKDSILIGEPIMVQLSITAPESFVNNYQWVSLPDTINHFEVVSRGDVERKINSGNITLTQTIQLTSFDSGRWALPTVTQKGISLQNNKLIYVNTVPVSALEDYRDIHDIAEIKQPFNYRPWLIGAAAALLLGVLFWFIARVAKKQTRAGPAAIPLTDAVKEALQEIEKLQYSKWPEAGEFKKFHHRLDEVFRRFLHRRYQTPAEYATNEEVLVQLKQTGIAGGYNTEIAQALRLNNYVKFAGYQPGAEQSYQCLQTIKKTIAQSVTTETPPVNAV